MFLDDMIAVLQQFRTQYPHRNIEIRGELQVVADKEKEHEQHLISCPPIIKKDETQSN
jgi:hypothetical protein